MQKPSIQIAVVGLGKLGLPLAAAISSRGYSVAGYDADFAKLAAFERGEFFFEPALKELILANRRNIRFSADRDILRDADVIFVVVPTPSREDGFFSTDFIQKAFEQLGEVLQSSKKFHVVSLVSTVLCGDTQKLIQVLEVSSGKECGVDFGVCYNPAFIALGNVIQNFLYPDFVLLGESDKKSGDILEFFYQNFCPQPPRIHRMSLVNAEIAKISVNTFVTMKISFANTLARICERIPGADSEVVAKALGDDSRIGAAYLKGAIGYGGPCFPRDNRAFSEVAQKAGVSALLAEATDQVNQLQLSLLARVVEEYSSRDSRILILGLSYKPDTDVIEESQGVGLAGLLAEKGYAVSVHDPQAVPLAKTILKDKVDFVENLNDGLEHAHSIVLITPWKIYQELEEKDFLGKTKMKKILIDCWKVYRRKQFSQKIHYVSMGEYLSEKKPQMVGFSR